MKHDIELTKEKVSQIIRKHLIAEVQRDFDMQDGLPEDTIYLWSDHGLISSTIFTGIKVVMSHQRLTISHFILAMFIISCNIQRASSGNIKIPEGAENLYFRT